MKSKILIGLILIFLVIGTVNAADINDYKLPDNFKVESEFWASNGDYGIGIYEYQDSDYETFFTNTSESTVYIADNITNYTDSDTNTVGCDELVEIDGEKFLIESYFEGTDDSKIKDCYDFLLDFNELNNFEPLEV